MSLEYIRTTYRVPATRGARVQYDGGDPDECPKLGTITGSRGAHLRIKMDGNRRSGIYHPTWSMTYLGVGGEPKGQTGGEHG